MGDAADRYRTISERWGRKCLIVAGMRLQAAGIFVTVATRSVEWWLLGSLLLGLGTALVYPALIAAVSDNSHPAWRVRSVSVYRFWRDLGCAAGALSAGIIADQFGISWAIGSVGTLTSVGALTLLSRRVVELFERMATDWDIMRFVHYDERIIERIVAVSRVEVDMIAAEVWQLDAIAPCSDIGPAFLAASGGVCGRPKLTALCLKAAITGVVQFH